MRKTRQETNASDSQQSLADLNLYDLFNDLRAELYFIEKPLSFCFSILYELEFPDPPWFSIKCQLRDFKLNYYQSV